jgi:DNA repair exonuclease SbcCD nuclease subunit
MVESLGPVSGQTSLLVVGDTHVGRMSHPNTGEEIDPIGAFATAVDHGIECTVDAVVHVGDIFHEGASSAQANGVKRRIFDPLEKHSIPFYYVRGNHSAGPGDRLLAKRSGVSKLDTAGERVGSDVRIFGIDHHEGGALPWKRLNFPDTVSESVRILVLHQTLRQLSGSKSGNVDLKRIQRRFQGRFDLILSGHHHDATIRDWNGTTVMYTGASERMSANLDLVDRVAWTVSMTKSLTPEKYEIP